MSDKLQDFLNRIDDHIEFHKAIDKHKSDVAFLNEVKKLFIELGCLPSEKALPETPTTKVCPNCGDTNLVLIPTQNMKLCTCIDPVTKEVTRIPWFKEDGQDDYY